VHVGAFCRRCRPETSLLINIHDVFVVVFIVIIIIIIIIVIIADITLTI